ncbi:hypothetical protein EV401DRAFT_1893922 [Pisolithus croceorrhizus]|nr:hypothetical protein EV401DRAFT_1893922 [Pisolithus croceorrhizus]
MALLVPEQHYAAPIAATPPPHPWGLPWGMKPPFTIVDSSAEGSVLVPDPPTWLLAALHHLDVPPEFTGSPPVYLGVTGDHSLHITTTATHTQVVSTIKLPFDPLYLQPAPDRPTI